MLDHAGGGASMILGVDLSYANGTPDWQTASKDERVKLVYSRCAYGTNPADDDGPIFATNHDACKVLSIPFGGYAFWIMGQDGRAQAEHWVVAANGRYGQNAFAVDVEEGSGVYGWGDSVQARIENLAATMTKLKAEIGEPMLCVNPDTWATYFGNSDAFSGHRVYLMDYTGVPGQFDAVPGLPNVRLHQFSDGSGQDPIPGLSTSDNNVDRDALIGGDLSVLARL